MPITIWWEPLQPQETTSLSLGMWGEKEKKKKTPQNDRKEMKERKKVMKENSEKVYSEL